MFYLIIRFLAVILFKILFRLDVFGRENIPSKGGFLLGVNHVSYLDPPVIAAACPRVVSFLATQRLFKNKFLGFFLTALHTFPLKSRGVDLGGLRWAIGELKMSKVIAIFPEGVRSIDGELHKPLAGVGLLAAKANVPVVPAFIEGSNMALPVGSKFIRLEKIRVYFGAPIYPQRLSACSGKDFYQTTAEKTMEAIAQLKDKRSHNLRSDSERKPKG